MGTNCPWPWSTREKALGPKSVNIFLGFFFMVNFCLGTGFLGVPYSFFYAGYLASIPTLLLIAFVSWNAATWEVEVMARAQAVEYFTKSQSGAGSSSEDDIDKPLVSNHDGIAHPKFEIVLARKFEPSELCEIFFNRWGKYFYLLIMTIYCFLAAWSFSTVAGSAWATNIPLNFGTLRQCEAKEFLHDLLPSGSCQHAYHFSLFLFGVIVVPFSMIDLKEQAIVQMVLGIMRFATIAMIIIYSIVNLIEGGNICASQNVAWDNLSNSSLVNSTIFWYNLSNSSLVNSTIFWYNLSNSSPTENTAFSNLTAPSFLELKDIVIKFDWRGWLVAIPVFTYAFIIHQGIPSLTHPIKQKQYLRWFMVCMFGIAGFCYLSLGVVAPLWFRARVQETVTLNWGNLAQAGNPPQLRALSYYLILFPSLDVCSAYPLLVHAITNNIYTVFMGQDTSEKPKYRFDPILRLLLRFFAAVIPILAALGISNLVYVLKYAGLFGFGICFFFPTALQLQSIRVCKKKFRHIHVAQKSNFNIPYTSVDHTEKAPLLSLQDGTQRSESSLYLTPYSNRILSHPVAVAILGTIALLFFLLTIAGLFVQPDKIVCVG